jgi:hypothetical protein
MLDIAFFDFSFVKKHGSKDPPLPDCRVALEAIPFRKRALQSSQQPFALRSFAEKARLG